MEELAGSLRWMKIGGLVALSIWLSCWMRSGMVNSSLGGVVLESSVDPNSIAQVRAAAAAVASNIGAVTRSKALWLRSMRRARYKMNVWLRYRGRRKLEIQDEGVVGKRSVRVMAPVIELLAKNNYICEDKSS